MLQWTTMREGPALALIVHHTDATREWAYDRDSPVGHLAQALDQAPDRGWLVIDMAADWARIYPFEYAAPLDPFHTGRATDRIASAARRATALTPWTKMPSRRGVRALPMNAALTR